MNFQNGKQLSENFYEVTRKSSRYDEKYPLHCGAAILHMSKLILLKFVIFLEENLVEDSFELVYTGKFTSTFVYLIKMLKFI